MIIESASVEHEFNFFGVCFGVARCILQPVFWKEKFSVRALIVERFDVVSLGIKDALAETIGPVFVL